MKNKSIVLAMCCVMGFGGVSSLIMIDPPSAIAQRSSVGQRNPQRVQRNTSRGEAVLTDRDPDARINLRSEPNLRSRVRGYGLVGDRVQVLNEQRSTSGGATWYEVQLLNSGDRGWVPSDNLQTGGTAGSGLNESMRLSQTGRGTLSISGRSDWEIRQVSVNVDERDQAEIALRLSDNRLIRFSGDVDERTAYSLRIDLEGSGNADASGTIDVEYGANNSINQLFGDGRLDGQPFSISFDGDRNTRNLNPNRNTGNFNNPSQEFLGQDVDTVVSRLRSQGWNVVRTTSEQVKLDRGSLGIDLEFNARTRRVTSVRMSES